jgi:hypothetical protein
MGMKKDYDKEIRDGDDDDDDDDDDDGSKVIRNHTQAQTDNRHTIDRT